MTTIRLIPFILFFIFPSSLTAQESIIISLNKVDSVEYYFILEKNVNHSELWARSQAFVKSDKDIKLATIETKLTKEASKLIIRQHHHERNNLVDAGRAQPLGSGVAAVIGTDKELLPACLVFITPNINMGFVKVIRDDAVIIADNFKKFDYGDPKDVQMKGLIPFELVEEAFFEAVKDFSVAN
ncbi:MAG: hypothetical protein IPJ75_17100 [Ignavibacteriales bacterium]|nr:hypothetical protein [Ignavibacteriales bacterium]